MKRPLNRCWGFFHVTTESSSQLIVAKHVFNIAPPIGSMYGIFTYIWLIFYGKCRYIQHTWMVWAMFPVSLNVKFEDSDWFASNNEGFGAIGRRGLYAAWRSSALRGHRWCPLASRNALGSQHQDRVKLHNKKWYQHWFQPSNEK